MSDETDTTADEPATSGQDTGADVGHDTAAERVTAPMSDYSMRAVGLGILVLAVGLAVAFVLPALATA